MTIEEALQKMAIHTVRNPKHGINCSCKDEFLIEAKNYIRENIDLYHEFLLLCTSVRHDRALAQLAMKVRIPHDPE